MPRAKTTLFVAIVVISNVAGNSVLNAGVKGSSVPMIAGGVALLILWTLARMSLLTWADLSWVVPITSLGYVLNVAAGHLIFREAVSASGWLGAVFVTAGAILVGAKER